MNLLLKCFGVSLKRPLIIGLSHSEPTQVYTPTLQVALLVADLLVPENAGAMALISTNFIHFSKIKA